MTASSPPIDDAELLCRIQSGDRYAFTMLVERHHQRFFRIAYRVVMHHADAEDVTQECFVHLWKKPCLWRAEKGVLFTTWFTRVVINRAINMYNARKHHRPDLLDTVADSRPSAETMLAEDDQKHWLQIHIYGLPEQQKLALNLCFFESYSNQEAADIMNISIKALQSLLMRAKTTLRTQYNALQHDEIAYAHGNT